MFEMFSPKNVTLFLSSGLAHSIYGSHSMLHVFLTIYLSEYMQLIFMLLCSMAVGGTSGI